MTDRGGGDRMKRSAPQARSLYLFALLPPEPIAAEIRGLQAIAAEKFASSEALSRPVHITLIPPFEATPATDLQLSDFVRAFASTRSAFEIILSGFGQFRGKVIYAHPVESNDLIQLQHALLMAFTAEFQDIVPRASHDRFRPHITVAYRDLAANRFVDAWEYFSGLGYEQRFNVEHLSLLRHEHRWVEVARGEFRIGSSEVEQFPS